MTARSYWIHACFQASWLLLVVVSSFLSSISTSMCASSPCSRFSNVIFSLDKKNCFYSVLNAKILGSTLSCHFKYQLIKYISESAIMLFIVSSHQPQKLSLLPLCPRKFSLCCFFRTQVSIAHCLSSTQCISDHLSSPLF